MTARLRILPAMSMDAGLPPAVEAYRVRRTFGFIDLSGFTRFSNEAGDDAAVRELSAFRAIVRSVGSSTGVRVAKWLGDGAMLVATDSALVVSAILEIGRRMRDRDLVLAMHSGVDEGLVILFEGDDYIGASVNRAARLADLAEPWQILAPVELFPGVATTEAAVGSASIQGFDEPVELADVAVVPQLIEALNL